MKDRKRLRVPPLMAARSSDQEGLDEYSEDEQVGSKEWSYIAIITAVSIAYYWQKFIFTYCYGFQGVGD